MWGGDEEGVADGGAESEGVGLDSVEAPISKCERSGAPGLVVGLRASAEPWVMDWRRSPTLRSSVGMMPLMRAPPERAPREMRT